MGDSEKSRILPPVTRRGLRSGTEARSSAQTVSLAADAAVAAAHSPLVKVPEPGGKRAVAAFTENVDSHGEPIMNGDGNGLGQPTCAS